MDTDHNRVWEWTNGSPFDFSYWLSDQPDGGQYYTVMDCDGSAFGKWRDLGYSDDRFHYICQLDLWIHMSIKIWSRKHQYNDKLLFYFYMCVYSWDETRIVVELTCFSQMPPSIIHPIVFTDPSVIRVQQRSTNIILFLHFKVFFSRRELFTRCEWLNIWRSLRSIGATVFPWDFARQYISVSPRNLTLLVMARRRRSSNAV